MAQIISNFFILLHQPSSVDSKHYTNATYHAINCLQPYVYSVYMCLCTKYIYIMHASAELSQGQNTVALKHVNSSDN